MNDKLKMWLDTQYLSWMSTQEKGKRSIGEFSKWLGISRSNLNNWMLKGKRPEGKNLLKLADKLGEGIYDVLDLPRPDPRLQAIIIKWGELDEAAKKRIENAIWGNDFTEDPARTKRRKR